MKIFILLLTSVLIIAGCATTEVTPTGVKVITQFEYERVLSKFSETSTKYQGFYNTLQVEATLLTSVMSQAQLEQNARLFLWNQEKMSEETKKANEKLDKQTDVFLSFFTPERKNDNLNKTQTNWRVFLDVDGKRYEGKVTKIKSILSEIQGLYPYHTRFSTPYNIVFPVSVKSIEQKPIRFTVTGSVDFAVLEYKPLALQ